MMGYLILQNAITQLFMTFQPAKNASSLRDLFIYYDLSSNVKFFL